jgi:hypothetical protein
MKQRLRAALTCVFQQATGLAVAGTVALAPLPALAAPPAEDEKSEAEEAAPAEPAGEVGGKVAVLRFGGSDPDGGNDYRVAVTEQLTEKGYEVKGVARTVEESAKKVKCKGSELDDKCLDRVGQYVNKNAKAEFDFFVYGTVNTQDAAGTSSIVIFDMAKKTKAFELEFQRPSEDYILPLSLPRAIAGDLAEYQVPPGPLTAEEEKIIATLDEPEKTEEEIAAEKKKLEEAEKARLAAFDQQRLQAKKDVDLKAEFDKFCRKGPREDQVVENEDGSETKIRDLRPACKRGPFWGYWQPRAYVALVLTGGLAVTTGLMYGLALGAHQDWKKASDDLEASGFDENDPNQSGDCDTGDCYANLAGKVSEAGARVRKNAILGDVFLGATVLMAGVLGIIISQDRAAAKGYLIQQKDLAMNVGPMLGNGTYGAGANFRF